MQLSPRRVDQCAHVISSMYISPYAVCFYKYTEVEYSSDTNPRSINKPVSTFITHISDYG